MCEKEILEKWPNKREKIRECLTASGREIVTLNETGKGTVFEM